MDSVDSVLVLYSYSGFPEEKWAIFRQTGTSEEANRQPNPIIAEKTGRDPVLNPSQRWRAEIFSAQKDLPIMKYPQET